MVSFFHRLSIWYWISEFLWRCIFKFEMFRVTVKRTVKNVYGKLWKWSNFLPLYSHYKILIVCNGNIFHVALVIFPLGTSKIVSMSYSQVFWRFVGNFFFLIKSWAFPQRSPNSQRVNVTSSPCISFYLLSWCLSGAMSPSFFWPEYLSYFFRVGKVQRYLCNVWSRNTFFLVEKSTVSVGNVLFFL
jgi:hypothetical protein